MIKQVLLLPPNDSERIRVNFESRYGICKLFLSVKATITFPSVVSDLLMFLASSSVWPYEPVLPIFSEPAKSTKYSLPVLQDPSSRLFIEIVIQNKECDRELSAFIFVAVVARFLFPYAISV